MRGRRTLALALLGLAQLAADCGGGTGSGGGGSTIRLSNVDPPGGALETTCTTLAAFFPPGFDFVPGADGLGWTVEIGSPTTFLPVDVEADPPTVAQSPAAFALPLDSDANGEVDNELPVVDDLAAESADLVWVTTSGYEAVLFLEPTLGGLRSFLVSLPGSFGPLDYINLPPPGSARLQTGVATRACIRPPPGTTDSQGNAIGPSFCDSAAPSFFTQLTSGAAFAGGHLFVSSSNLARSGTDPRFDPGSVLVYDVDLAASPPAIAPNAGTPFLLTTGFNPTHVTAYGAGGREFVLVSVSGSLGLAVDDPGTPDIESGSVALSDAAIDVIDAVSLELVATIPLGRAGLSFDRLAVDPTGRVAVTGSAVRRELFAVDLAPLAALPASVARPVVLDGSEGDSSVIFDAATPYVVPARDDGAPPARCPGFTAGTGWNAAGDLLFATDFCDGTLAIVEVELAGSPPVPVPRERFGAARVEPIAAPLRSDTGSVASAPGTLEVRAGRPGVDYHGPDVIVLLGQPGLLCGVRVESL